jgi:iron complex outermembrane receptor protein
MKKHTFIAGVLCISLCTSASSQDSTDVFYKHLRLDEVTVTGLTGVSKLSQTPSAISVADARSLRQNASTNIIDAIATLPGVSQITTGSGISKPVIRGMGYNRVILMADGIRQEGQQWGDEHGIEVDESAVGSVEVMKGPASLMYGSDALAGVIILNPDPFPEPDVITAGVSSEYQTNNGLAAYSVHQSGNRNGTVWDIRFSDKYAHSFRNAADGLVPGTQFRERAVSGKAGLNSDWGFTRLTLGYYHMTPGMTEGYEDDETELEGPTGYSVELPFQQIHHYKAVLDNSFVIGNGSLKALVGVQQNRRQEFEEEEDEAELDFKLRTVNYELRYLTDEIGDSWKFSTGVGGMYQQSKNLGEEVLIPAYNLFDAGLFATATKSLEHFTLSGGIRADMRRLESFFLEDKFEAFNRNFTGITGSIGAVFSPSDHLNIRANIARGFRAPNLSELASNGVHEGTVRYERGNIGLEPEFSLQGDLGADVSLEHLALNAALFCNRIDNYIYSARTGTVIDSYDEYQFKATDALLYGAEFTADCHPVHALHIGADFSYVRGTFESSDMPLIPAPKVGAEIKWEITHSGGILNNCYLAVNADHHFRQDHYLEGTETATDAYTLIGASAHTDIQKNGKRVASISLIGDNLTDKVYVDHLNRLKYVGIRNPGRNITLKLEIPLTF